MSRALRSVERSETVRCRNGTQLSCHSGAPPTGESEIQKQPACASARCSFFDLARDDECKWHGGDETGDGRDRNIVHFLAGDFGAVGPPNRDVGRCTDELGLSGRSAARTLMV